MDATTQDFKWAMKGLWLLILGIVGYFVLLAILDASWRNKHEKLAHEVCDAISIGTAAQVAHATALAKKIPEIDIKDMSITAHFLNPYDPGEKIVCDVNLLDNKVFNNEVWARD